MEKRRDRRWLWWGAGILVIIIAIVVGFLIKNNQAKDANIINNTQETTKNADEKTSEAGEARNDTQKEEQTEVKKEEIKQYAGDNPNDSESLTGVVSYAAVNNGNLMIRVNIDQYLVSGNCILKLIRNGDVIYSSTVGIETSVSTSTCSGFNVLADGLGSGRIEIEVGLESGEKRGTIRGEVGI